MPAKFVKTCLVAASACLCLGLTQPASAALNWKGFTWNLTDGGMAGVAEGDANNISVDNNGYLHLRIVNNGGTWTASEMFTQEHLGFGTYQWQIEGPIDVYDKQIVLGLFPYGPADGIGGDGTNEIDIEFARWGQANGPNADFTDYPNSGNTIGETTFKFSLGGGTSSTARMHWVQDSIESTVLKGHQAIGSDAELIKRWKYAPQNPGTNIPQNAMPLGINLWCFDAPPTDGQNMEIVIRDFQFIKEGDPIPKPDGGGGMGAGGMSGGGMGTGGNAEGGSAGSVSMGGAIGMGGATGGVSTGGVSDPSGGSFGQGGANGGKPSGSGGTQGPTGQGGASSGAAGTPNNTGGSSTAGTGNNNSNGDADAGCSCKVPVGESSHGALLASLATLLIGIARRRRASS
jgi:hypothetical protein